MNDCGKSVKGSRILILGVAYKKNVDDQRESPSFVLMNLLMQKGAVINYSDPHIPSIRPMRKFNFKMESVRLTPEILSSYDCVLIATDHDSFDYELIRENSLLIVDTRGRYREPMPNIVKA